VEPGTGERGLERPKSGPGTGYCSAVSARCGGLSLLASVQETVVGERLGSAGTRDTVGCEEGKWPSAAEASRRPGWMFALTSWYRARLRSRGAIQGRAQALSVQCSAPLAAPAAERLSPGGLAPAGRFACIWSVRDLLRMHSGHYRERPNSPGRWCWWCWWCWCRWDALISTDAPPCNAEAAQEHIQPRDRGSLSSLVIPPRYAPWQPCEISTRCSARCRAWCDRSLRRHPQQATTRPAHAAPDRCMLGGGSSSPDLRVHHIFPHQRTGSTTSVPGLLLFAMTNRSKIGTIASLAP
jgi:hypothetical protein